MQQVYVTNMDQMKEVQQGQEYELHRIADWMDALVSEMRYANAMTRVKLGVMDHKQLKDQGY